MEACWSIPSQRIVEVSTILNGNHFTPWSGADAIRDAVEKVADAMRAPED